jgi:hypothetical protein
VDTVPTSSVCALSSERRPGRRTGEIELLGDDVAGIAARLTSLAGSDEVVAPRR